MNNTQILNSGGGVRDRESVRRARISGTGSYIPENIVSTEKLFEIFSTCSEEDKRQGKFKPLEWIKAGTEIKTRAFINDISKGTLVEPVKGELDLAMPAVEQALKKAGWQAHEVDRIYYVTCTEVIDAFGCVGSKLQKKLGMVQGTIAETIHSGCGGSMLALHKANQAIINGEAKKILLVATNNASRHFQKDVYMRNGGWLCFFVFGDAGACWAIEESTSDQDSNIIIATDAFTDDEELMTITPVEYDGKTVHVYYIKGHEVAEAYQKYMLRAIQRMHEKYPFQWRDIDLLIPHQVNMRVLRSFLTKLEVSEAKVAINVDRFGNLASTCTMVLFDEALKSGRIKSGEKILFATMGAGVHAGTCIMQS